MSLERPDLAALVLYWQTELRLLDWRLDVSYVPDLSLDGGAQVWGLCSPLVDNKTATILIRDPFTPPNGATSDQACAQVEETIVHELTHLHLAVFATDSPAERAAEEQAVWALSTALCRAKGKPTKLRQIVRAMIARTTRTRKAQTKMDPETIKKALEAIKAGDGDAACTILEALLTQAASGATAAEVVDTDEDEEEKDDMAKTTEPGAAAPMGGATSAAVAASPQRARAAMDAELTRARKAGDSLVRSAVRAMIHEARTVDGIALPASVETSILAETTVDGAAKILSTARAMIAQAPKRANSGAVARAAGAGTTTASGNGAVDPDSLNRTQRATYNRFVANGDSESAETHLKACGQANARLAGKAVAQ